MQKGGKSLLGQFPALCGVPQLSFEGRLDNKPVIGYSANDLTHAGYEDFGKILENDAQITSFQTIPLFSKMRLAAQFVSAFDFLSNRLHFIHADIKAEALFIDLSNVRCAIIDFDSGALARDPSDKPTTYGTRQDWLAPEIIAQLDSTSGSNRLVKVDILSDVWSVAIAIHYLLFGFHPLFFLTEISERSMREYLGRFQWPDADSRCSYFRYSRSYSQYHQFITTLLPQEILRRFAFTINKGYSNPSQRTTYGQWNAIFQATNQPRIQHFTADRTFLTDARPVRLNWNVTGAARLEITGIGNVMNQTSIDIPVKQDTVFELVLIPDAGPPIRRSIHVQVSKEPPAVNFFTSDKGFLATASPARLSWSITGSVRTEIDQGVGDVTGQSHVDVLPKHDAIFTLTATSYFGVSVTAQIELRVSSVSPEILFFRGDRSHLADERPLELTWNVSDDAYEVSISGIGVVASQGTIEIDQRQDTIYMLTASSYFGYSSTADLEITVSKVPPAIEEFKSSPSFLWEGMEAELSWRVSGSEAVFIEPQLGPVPAQGRRNLGLISDERCTVRAISYYGIVALEEIHIWTLKLTKLCTDLTELINNRTALTTNTTLLAQCSRQREDQQR
jgi:serine/threonine protein kinase